MNIDSNKLIRRMTGLGLALAFSMSYTAPALAAGGQADGEDAGLITDSANISVVAEAVKKTVKDTPELDNSYYNLLLGGQVLATFQREFDAESVIDCIEDHFVFDDMEGATVSFEPELAIEKKSLTGENPVFNEDVNGVINQLMKGGSERVVYTAEAEDTLWGISESFGVDVEELQKLNPIVDPENIVEGSRIIVKPSEPLLRIAVSYEEERDKELDFKKVKEETDELYQGEKVVIQQGEKGFAYVVEQVKKVNGVEASREEISREVLWEPIDEIVLVGTAERPDGMPAPEENFEYEEEYVEEPVYDEPVDTYEAYETGEEVYDEAPEEIYEETYDEPEYEVYDEPSEADEGQETYEEVSAGEPSGDAYAEGQRIANYAMQFIGNPYVWGGTSLTDGCDCSGFVYRVYNDCGYPVDRMPELSSICYPVTGELIPGDIIVYPHHNALYIGGGQCVEALNYENGICICPLGFSDSYYYAVRVVR